MIKNQLKLVWRTLLKNRMTSLINLVGLTIGLTATILIGLYLANEWQTDRSLPDPDHTYRLLRVSNINHKPYEIISSWLSDFAYQIDMPLLVYEGAVLIFIFFAGIAVAYHGIKTSLLNPVEVLRENDSFRK